MVFILSTGETEIPLSEYVNNNEVQVLQTVHSESGWSPLHFASWVGSIPCAKYLVSQGLSLTSTGDADISPYLLSAISGHSSFFESFVQTEMEHLQAWLRQTTEIGF